MKQIMIPTVWRIHALEDNAYFLHIIERVFKKYKIEDYRLFEDADKFMSQMSRDVHIIIVDYNLDRPDLNGLDIIRRAREVNSQCWAILISNTNDPDVLEEIINNQINNFVRKHDTRFEAKLVAMIEKSTEWLRREYEFFNEMASITKAADEQIRLLKAL